MSFVYQPSEIVNDKYRITGILGKGGVAITYSAIALEIDTTAAIKVVSLKQLDNWKQIELFQREAEILKQLEHPAIPRYIDYFDIETKTDKAFYLVQQIAPGKSLNHLVESGWRASEEEIKDIARQVLNILSYLHSLDPPVIHRDLKPSNLIRDDDGKIYLVDFGAVQNTYYNTLMQGSTVVGTYGYMSPEQFRGQAFPATDLYSLGATLLYLLTHRSPVELPHDTLKLDFRNSVDLDDSFADWLEKILEPDIEDRFSDAEVALAELFKSKKKKQRKFIASASAIVIGFFLLIVNAELFVSHQWWLLSRLGYSPGDLCSNSLTMNNYLETGGKLTNILERQSIYGSKTKKIGCVEAILFSLFDRKQSANLEFKQKQKIINLLLQRNINIDNKTSLLISSILLKDKQMLNFLLEKNIAINVRDISGRTALHHAIASKDIDTIKLLIDRGANLNAKDNSGMTPLYYAARLSTNLEAVKLLLNRGADLNSKDNFGRNLLHHAAMSDTNLEAVKLLLDRGADPNSKDNLGSSPLHYAFKKRFLPSGMEDIVTVKLLLDRGADVDATDNYKKTPLHYAVERQNPDLSAIKLLIDRGASFYIKDNSGHTALSKATIDLKLDAAQYLIDRGANFDYLNNGEVRKNPLRLFDRNYRSQQEYELIKQFFDNNKK